MQFDQFLRDGQAETDPLVVHLAAVVGLLEWLEQRGHVLRSHADPFVFDREPEIVVHPLRRHTDRPPGMAELQGIGDEVDQDLLEPQALQYRRRR